MVVCIIPCVYPSLDPNWANFWFLRTVPSPADQTRVLVQGENTSRARENLCTPLLSKTCYPGLLEAALLETKKLSESSASQSSGQWFWWFVTEDWVDMVVTANTAGTEYLCGWHCINVTLTGSNDNYLNQKSCQFLTAGQFHCSSL